MTAIERLRRDLFGATFVVLSDDLRVLFAQHDAMREALERIALGVTGRQTTGLRENEVDGSGVAKTDWRLAADVLARLKDGQEFGPDGVRGCPAVELEPTGDPGSPSGPSNTSKDGQE